ncbi:hypothetical protein GGR53DRAFT_531041 [Hypoxylon sp. FL1150]|nr:hypothetical protein GGR53DRAFT_531041 [Hypoxylon sp. FL1150]
MTLSQQPVKFEFRSLEANFLDLERLRKLPVDSEERQFRIIRRCNWYMFSAPTLRGKAFDDSSRFAHLCHTTAEPNCPPEQEQPNQRLADEPPPESFLAKYHSEYPKDSKRERFDRDTISIADIQRTLIESWDRWRNVSTKAKRLETAIDSIPNPERIKKVVCLGLGRILEPLDVKPPTDPETAKSCPDNIIMPRNIAQHLAAIAIVKHLEKKTGQQIPLYAADPEYTPRHKKALETLLVGRFIILDCSYGKHEQFTVIDDNTLLFDMTGPPQCPTMRIIQEYARPAAIITKEVPRAGVFQDRLWFEVKEEDGTKVQVPGCADLPFPFGCTTFGGLCPKRVRDTIVDEYELEDKFPAEAGSRLLDWNESDLIDYEGRSKSNTRAGGYWFSDTRLYVRKDGPSIPAPIRTQSRRRRLVRGFRNYLL